MELISLHTSSCGPSLQHDRTPLRLAVKHKKLECIRLLLDARADPYFEDGMVRREKSFFLCLGFV